MENTLSKTELEDIHALLPNNPFVPPKGGICFVNDLPSELLSRIFEVGCADDDGIDNKDEEEIVTNYRDGDGDKSKDTLVKDEKDIDHPTRFFHHRLPFPMVLSHVCRHWRNVALSNLALWAIIIITPGARPPYQLESTLLERSNDLPLDIDVNCDSLVHEDREVFRCTVTAKPPSEYDVNSLFSLLTSHIHRWRSIKVTTADHSLMHPFQRAVSDSAIPAAPRLTTLELYDTTATRWCSYAFEYDGLMSEHLTLFGGFAPLLTRVVLWGVPVHWDQPWITSACNLREIDLAFHPEGVRPTWTQFATILRGAPALEELGLRLSSPSGNPAEWYIKSTPQSSTDLNAPIQLPHVTKFVLADLSEDRATTLLQKLSFPSLKYLSLSFTHGSNDYSNFVHELARPAAGLSCIQRQPHSLLNRLEHLTIDALPCDAVSVAKLYGELQNLTTLNIWMSTLRPTFLDALMPCPVHRGGVWLPRLATLYISAGYGSVLRDIAQKRDDVGVPLSALYVDEISDVENEDARWFKENLKSFGSWGGSL